MGAINIEKVIKYTQEILEKFYRTELREGEDTIDNRTETIAKELKLPVHDVSRILDEHLDKKFYGITVNRESKAVLIKMCIVNELTGEVRNFPSNLALSMEMGIRRNTSYKASVYGYLVKNKYRIYNENHYEYNKISAREVKVSKEEA